jgi:hypothetical protein
LRRVYGNEKATFTLPNQHQQLTSSSIFSAKLRQITKAQANSQRLDKYPQRKQPKPNTQS